MATDISVPQQLGDRFTNLDQRLKVTERPSPWLVITPGSGWANFGAGYEALASRKVSDLVQVRGLIKRSSGTPSVGEVLFTLPAGQRPVVRVLLGVMNSGATLTYIDVATSGAVTYQAGSAASTATWISVSSIMFSVLPTTTL